MHVLLYIFIIQITLYILIQFKAMINYYFRKAIWINVSSSKCIYEYNE